MFIYCGYKNIAAKLMTLHTFEMLNRPSQL